MTSKFDSMSDSYHRVRNEREGLRQEVAKINAQVAASTNLEGATL